MRGSGNAAEPLCPMASKISKKFCAVRLPLRSAVVNGRAAAGSAAVFFTVKVIFLNIDYHA